MDYNSRVRLTPFPLCSLFGPSSFPQHQQIIERVAKVQRLYAEVDGALTPSAFLGSETSSGPTSSRPPGHSEPANVPFSPFNIAYYQSYFDVDTNTVLKRVGLSMIPRANFIAEACNGSIDLYGKSHPHLRLAGH